MNMTLDVDFHERYRKHRARALQDLAEIGETFNPSRDDMINRRLISVSGHGVYVPAENLKRYRDLCDELSAREEAFRRENLRGVIYAHVSDVLSVWTPAEFVERAAIMSLGMDFHDDRGDGLLYVPALHRREAMAAYREAFEFARKMSAGRMPESSIVRGCLH